MSSIARKVENLAHPERREYYNSAAQGSTVADPSAPRTAHVTHGGPAHVGAGTHTGAHTGAHTGTHAGTAGTLGSEYTTTGHPRPHEHINSTQGKHGYIQYGQSAASGPAPTTAGPHRHDMMNKIDPRVDSTADHRPVKLENTHAHNSKLANILDPRVDSSVANHPNMATTGGVHTHSGAGMGPTTGAGYHEPVGRHGGVATHEPVARHGGVARHEPVGRHEPLGSHAATGAYGGAGHHGATHHTVDPTGPATHTAGPHKSNLLNKLDPSVDSRTGATTGTSHTAGEPVMHGAGATRY